VLIACSTMSAARDTPSDVVTLPLSGRKGTLGGAAESRWWPVHSMGLFEVSLQARDSLI